MTDVIFNIYGGNNQILPNATKAEQNFYGEEYAEKKLGKKVHDEVSEEMQSNVDVKDSSCALSEDEQRLAIYVNNVETLRGYIALLRSCKTARELGEVVATMCQQESTITEELIVKQCFITLLLPFVPKWKKGQTIDNIRVAINSAWPARKRAMRLSER